MKYKKVEIKLGRKFETVYYAGRFSLKRYENGWIFKAVKYPPLIFSISQGYQLARFLRNKCYLKNKEELDLEYKQKMAEKI